MATSPNYGWSEPDNSSLVKNGASDIRTLGDAIDTSVWNVGFGQAGKNKIINGDFSVNQRNFTSTTTTSTYGFDRWFFIGIDGTVTYSAQTFTAGTAPVAGYEGTNFARIVSSGQTATSAQARLRQQIEDVRTFAGQTVTMSFWAKASSGTPYINAAYGQGFGTGGSSGVFGYATKQTITTSWARYSFTMSIPSISGKTIGPNSSLGVSIWTSAGSDLNSFTDSLGIQSATIDIWGVQVEYGSKATPFQTATGTIQGELAACQRYYYRAKSDGTGYPAFGNGVASASNQAYAFINFPVIMRTNPTALETSGTATDYGFTNSVYSTITCATAPAFLNSSTRGSSISGTVTSGLASGIATTFYANNTTNAYLAWSAEL